MNSARRLGRFCTAACFACCLVMMLDYGISAAQSSGKEENGSAGSPGDKSRYNLFNPTPPEKMREFLPDRPDKTESPYTIDAGHFAIETGIVSYTYNHMSGFDASRPQHQVLIGDNNFKAGVLNNMDLQFVFQSFIWQRAKIGPDTHSDDTGVGDAQVRAKINLWGNDAGRTAMAIMPWVGLPISSLESGNNKVTGGVIFPFGFDGPWGWKIGLMTEIDSINDAIGSGYHVECVNTIALHHDIIPEKLDGYIEFFSNNSFDAGSPWEATIDVGLIYEVSRNFYLDCGVNVGVTKQADDVNPFIGFAKRF